MMSHPTGYPYSSGQISPLRKASFEYPLEACRDRSGLKAGHLFLCGHIRFQFPNQLYS